MTGDPSCIRMDGPAMDSYNTFYNGSPHSLEPNRTELLSESGGLSRVSLKFDRKSTSAPLLDEQHRERI